MSSQDSPGKRLLGLVTGLAFGALLQRGRLSRYDVIVGQMLANDWRVVKTMATAMAVGAVGFHALLRRGLTKRDVKPMKVGGVVGGAALFGSGMALLGYCPGTSVAAVGEGQRDAVIGVLGMLAGATAFVTAYPSIAPALDAGGDLGKVTLPSVTATASAPWVKTIAGATVAAAALAERHPR